MKAFVVPTFVEEKIKFCYHKKGSVFSSKPDATVDITKYSKYLSRSWEGKPCWGRERAEGRSIPVSEQTKTQVWLDSSQSVINLWGGYWKWPLNVNCMSLGWVKPRASCRLHYHWTKHPMSVFTVFLPLVSITLKWGEEAWRSIQRSPGQCRRPET